MTSHCIRLHLGAHKTATTYIQDRLDLNKERIAASGSAYWPLLRVRPLVRDGIRFANEQERSRYRFLRKLMGRPLNLSFDRLKTLCSVDRPVTISEENILGDVSELFGGIFYPNLHRRLELILSCIPDRPIEIWLSLRSYPDFLAAIYAESLRHGAFVPLEEYMLRHASPTGQWTQVIDTIRSASPTAKLIVWRYEDFQMLESVIFSCLSGLPFKDLRSLPDAQVRPSPSAEATFAMTRIAGSLRPIERELAMATYEELYQPVGGHRFSPWSCSQNSEMEEAYNIEWQKIRNRADIEFLD